MLPRTTSLLHIAVVLGWDVLVPFSQSMALQFGVDNTTDGANERTNASFSNCSGYRASCYGHDVLLVKTQRMDLGVGHGPEHHHLREASPSPFFETRKSQAHAFNAALSLKQASSTWISWLQPPQPRPCAISCRNPLPVLEPSESWFHPASPTLKDSPLLRSFRLTYAQDWIQGWGILARLAGVAGRRGQIRHVEQLSRANEGPTPK